MHFWEFQTPEKNPVFPSRFRYIPEKNPVSGVGTRFRCHTDTDTENRIFFRFLCMVAACRAIKIFTRDNIYNIGANDYLRIVLYVLVFC